MRKPLYQDTPIGVRKVPTNQLKEIEGIGQLKEIEGIGKTYAEEIRDALNDLRESGNGNGLFD